MRFFISLKKKDRIIFAESLCGPFRAVGEYGGNLFGYAIFFCDVEVTHIFPDSHNQSTKHRKQYANSNKYY
jgi:hypothetical protein